MTGTEWKTYYGWDVISDARAWIADVVGNPEDVEDASDDEIFRHVRRNYSGGWAAFVADMAPENAELQHRPRFPLGDVRS